VQALIELLLNPVLFNISHGDNLNAEKSKNLIHSNYGWVIMGQFWYVDLFSQFIFFSVGILLPIWRDELGITVFQSGILGAIGFFGFALISIPSGMLLPRYNPRKVIFICTLIMSIFAFAHGLASTPILLIISRFGFVVSMVCWTQVKVLFMQKLFTQNLYPLINSIDFGIKALGQLVTFSSVAYLIVFFGGWSAFFFAIGVLLLLFLPMWFFFGKEKNITTKLEKLPEYLGNPISILKRKKSLWLLAGAQIGAAFPFACFVTFYPTFLLETMDLEIEAVGFLMSLFPLGSVLGSFSAGPISQLIGRRKPLIWIPGLLLPVCYILILHVTNLYSLGIILFIMGMLAFAVAPVLFTIPFDMQLKPQELVIALGLIRTLFPIGATIGPLLVSLIRVSTGSLYDGLLIAAPMAFTLLICGLIMPETGPIVQNKNINSIS
jgi:MFS family permease